MTFRYGVGCGCVVRRPLGDGSTGVGAFEVSWTRDRTHRLASSRVLVHTVACPVFGLSTVQPGPELTMSSSGVGVFMGFTSGWRTSACR